MNLLVDGKGTVKYEIATSEPKAKNQKYIKAQITMALGFQNLSLVEC